MSKQVRFRRGTTAENDAFTGALGEVTFDTEKSELRLHDGETAGGRRILSGNTPITSATHPVISYDERGFVLGGRALNANEIPDLSASYVVKSSTPLTPGTACKVSYNANGLITGVSNLAVVDIPTLPQSKITGLESALSSKAEKIPVEIAESTSGSLTLIDNAINVLNLSGSITLATPSVSDNTVLHQMIVQLYKPQASYTVALGATKYFGGVVPDISSIGYYNIYYEYDAGRGLWVVGAIKKSD